MIFGCLIFYNEAQFLEEWCERVAPYVDKVIAIDGRIEGFPGDSNLSDDGSHEILERHGISRIALAAPWPTEHEKRSMYLAGSPGDWYVVIDADEMLENGDELRDEIDRIDVSTSADFAQIKVVGYGADRLAGRVFRHQHGLAYIKRHLWLGVAGEVVWQGDTGPVLNGPYLRHLKSERSPERLRAKGKFHAVQAKTENVLP